MRFTVQLDDSAARDPLVVGGKAAALARLAAAGLPATSGFCVTTAAFGALTGDPETRARVRELAGIDPGEVAALQQAAKELRQHILGRSLPGAVADAVQEALDALGAGAVAVRSSATVEDLPEASVAGQHDSFLNVPPGEVLDAVRACMASLYTDRAVAYRARSGIPHERATLAVLVQPQFDPEAAGVTFTADPQTGERSVTVTEAAFGLGSGLVGGEAVADRARVHRTTGERAYEVGGKQQALRPRPGGGTRTVDLDPGRSGARVLTDAQVDRLVELGARTQELFGAPQDVEWVLTGGEVVLLQARPITSLFPVPEPEPADGRLHVYLSMGHVQALPEAMPPLVRDVWENYVNSVFAILNSLFAGLAPASSGPSAAHAGGRVYIDLTPLLRVRLARRRLARMLAAVNEPASAGLLDLLDRRGGAFDKGPRPPRSGVRDLVRRVRVGTVTLGTMVPRFLAGVVRAVAGGAPDPDGYQRWWEEWAREASDRIHGQEDLAGRVRATFHQDGTQVLRVYPQVVPLYAAFVAGAALERWFRDAPEDVNRAGSGFPREIVTRINLGLGDLADHARERPAVAAALRDGQGLEEVAGVEGGEEFTAAAGRYLDEFGHRATGELDVSRPRWREDPTALLRIVRANLAGTERGEHRERLRRLEREGREAAGRLERRAGRGVLGPVRRRAARRLLRLYRNNIRLREHPKQGVAHLFVTWRETLLAAGEHLAAQGRLDRPDDVWLLHAGELQAALEGGAVEADLEARRAELDRDAARSAPPLLTSDGEIPSGKRGHADVPEGALVGTPVSAGVVEGPARVIRDPSEATVERGEILVAPSTDPGWAALFLNASALVTEVGGQLSHGALVAREYGLPAVVSVASATAEIRTGQPLRVDGTRGTVELVEEPPD